MKQSSTFFNSLFYWYFFSLWWWIACIFFRGDFVDGLHTTPGGGICPCMMWCWVYYPLYIMVDSYINFSLDRKIFFVNHDTNFQLIESPELASSMSKIESPWLLISSPSKHQMLQATAAIIMQNINRMERIVLRGWIHLARDVPSCEDSTRLVEFSLRRSLLSRDICNVFRCPAEDVFFYQDKT